jgi:hypothetical protein
MTEDCFYLQDVKNKILAVVSSWPIFSFFRNLLSYLENAPTNMALPTIYSLCEIPVLPIPFAKYQIELSFTISPIITFGAMQNVEESDFDTIALTIFTPFMMIKAWEAMILDRSILVVSKNLSLLFPCCEFLRKLIYPLPFSGAFVPVLPSIELLEATGTFLMGVESKLLSSSEMSLAGIVILNLDLRKVIHTPPNPEDPYYAAPPFLLQSMLDKVISIQNMNIENWLQRPIHQSNEREPVQSDFHVSFSNRSTELLQYFAFVTTCLLSFQLCSSRSFYRIGRSVSIRPFFYQLFPNIADLLLDDRDNDENESDFDFIGLREECGYIVGCIYFWKNSELYVDEEREFPLEEKDYNLAGLASPPFLLCWSELDQNYLAIYEFVDDLPFLLIPVDEMHSISPSTLKPLGQVFEITLKSSQILRFSCTDQKIRQSWIDAIEKKIAFRANCASSTTTTISPT